MLTRDFRRPLGLIACFAFAAASASCGEVARTGRSPVFLIIDSLQAASGENPLLSDVERIVDDVPTIFNDVGEVTLRVALKNPGTSSSPLTPSTLNDVTLTRYRVSFRRTDGRSTQGVDVPYTFDGGMTVTIPAGGSATQAFDLVRHQAKLEPPLVNLARGGGAIFISTIAEVTFFGRDQAGNEVQVAGSLSVQFGDFADSD